MRSALALALVASLAHGAEPGEATAKGKAYRLDAPFAIEQDGETLLELPSGVVMDAPTFDSVDREFVRLQQVEHEHKNEPGPVVWFVVGSIVGGFSIAGLLVGAYLITR